MFVNTHLLIANRITTILQKTPMNKIKKNYFIYGNIHPDLTSFLNYRPHRMKESLDYVLEEVNKLLLPKFNDADRFSTSLGAVSHYFSDFFCSPHYDRSKFNGFCHHMNYELKLHLRFKKINTDSFFDISKLRLMDFYNQDLRVVISNLEKEYLKKSLCVENDILFAMRSSILAVTYILANTSFEFGISSLNIDDYSSIC